ncbi:MAG: hypothetical protein JSW58_08515 [Candidatus Latescibacterota bacterium]|nr:MAG: hypothetical protein JSW58_08515 [Candidatus Latescibacterota bacterium]
MTNQKELKATYDEIRALQEERARHSDWESINKIDSRIGLLDEHAEFLTELLIEEELGDAFVELFSASN